VALKEEISGLIPARDDLGGGGGDSSEQLELSNILNKVSLVKKHTVMSTYFTCYKT
jgi:hypothetical protein